MAVNGNKAGASVTGVVRTHGCRSCEGRGWRYASRRGLLRLAEDTVTLVRRRCPDCLGDGQARDTGASAAGSTDTPSIV
jgi:hypothetical protein